MDTKTGKSGKPFGNDESTVQNSGNEQSVKGLGTQGTTKGKPSLTIDLESERKMSKPAGTQNKKEDGKKSEGFYAKETQSEGRKSGMTGSSSNLNNTQDKDVLESKFHRNLGRFGSNLVAAIIGGLIVFFGIQYFLQLGIVGSDSTETESRLSIVEETTQQNERRLGMLENQTNQTSQQLEVFFDVSNENSELYKLNGILMGYHSDLEVLSARLDGMRSELTKISVIEDENSEAGQRQGQGITIKGEQTGLDPSDLQSMKLELEKQQESVDRILPLVNGFEFQISLIEGQLESIEGQISELSGAESEISEILDRLNFLESVIESGATRELASRAIAIIALKVAVDRGQPYDIELSVVSSFLPEVEEIPNLKKQSTTGIPTTTELISEFPKIAREMDAVSYSPTQNTGTIESFLSSIRSLIVIRDAQVSDSSDIPSLIFAMENSVANADFENALMIFDKIPESIQQPAVAWIESVGVRMAVDTQLDRVTMEVIGSLSNAER